MSEVTIMQAPHKLVIVILDDPQLVEDLIMGLVELGVKGATVVESRGMGEIIRQDMPVFAGLATLFPKTTHSMMVMSLMPAELVEASFDLVNDIVGYIERENSAICFSLPVESFRGIRK